MGQRVEDAAGETNIRGRGESEAKLQFIPHGAEDGSVVHVRSRQRTDRLILNIVLRDE